MNVIHTQSCCCDVFWGMISEDCRCQQAKNRTTWTFWQSSESGDAAAYRSSMSPNK